MLTLPYAALVLFGSDFMTRTERERERELCAVTISVPSHLRSAAHFRATLKLVREDKEGFLG